MVNPFIEEIPNTSDEEAVTAAVLGHLSQMWFAMPAVAAQDTMDGHIAQLQIALNGTQIDGKGNKTNPAYPLLNEVPVHHHGGGQNVHTMPVVKGDEILAIFTSRPHDTWHQNGGTMNNPIDARIHHMSDAFSLRGYRSDPRKIQNVSNVSSQNRSIDGKHTHDVHPVNGITAKSVDPRRYSRLTLGRMRRNISSHSCLRRLAFITRRWMETRRTNQRSIITKSPIQ